jgi:hypothetical protein
MVRLVWRTEKSIRSSVTSSGSSWTAGSAGYDEATDRNRYGRRMPMRLDPLQGRWRTRRSLCLPLPGMPETIVLRLRHLGNGQKLGSGALVRHAADMDPACFRRRHSRLRILPAMRNTPMAWQPRSRSNGQHQGWLARHPARPVPSQAHLDIAEAPGGADPGRRRDPCRRAAGIENLQPDQ